MMINTHLSKHFHDTIFFLLIEFRFVVHVPFPSIVYDQHYTYKYKLRLFQTVSGTNKCVSIRVKCIVWEKEKILVASISLLP